MNRFAVRAALSAAAVIFAYHLVTATMARVLGMTYRQAAWFELGIYLTFVIAGYLAARRSDWLWIGVVAALAAGLADGVLGWRITGAIFHLVRPIFDHDNVEFEFAIQMLVVSALFGAFGGLLGKLSNRIRPYRPKPGTP